MDIRDGFVGSVGNTPLIKLRRASEETGCTILGKAEQASDADVGHDLPLRPSACMEPCLPLRSSGSLRHILGKEDLAGIKRQRCDAYQPL
jgi:hypothetical protein